MFRIVFAFVVGVMLLFGQVGLAAISEDSSGFVNVADVVPGVMLDIRYATAYNFVGEPIAGYEEPVALLTKEAASALAAVQDEVRERGYAVKIYDAYRPQRAVDHFVRWAKDVGDTQMKEIFYPQVAKEDLFELDYIGRRSGHSKGSTVDLTLYDTRTQMDLDMGGTFDFFGERSHVAFPDLTDEQRANRNYLQKVMTKHGFYGLYSEWWHFTLEDEPYPDTYFNFPVRALKKAA